MLLPTPVWDFDSTCRHVRINEAWQFHRELEPRDAPGHDAKPYAGSEWQTVNLPHSARYEDDLAPKFDSFQGVVWYQKEIQFQPKWSKKHVEIVFDGAMQSADVWVNGSYRTRHTGGYLPFSIDLTKDAASGKLAKILVRLDNRDNPSFPPGRAQRDLDFTYAGGLYRNVWLEVTNPSHINNVFAYSKNFATDSADVVVQATISEPEGGEQIAETVFAPDGRQVASALAPVGSPATFHLIHPMLWDLDHPRLYRVITELSKRGKILDRVSTELGIRHIEFDEERGFRLNGRNLKLQGSNRHMAFPIVGNAASDAAQVREAKRLKALGLNILRLAHYPQSPAFLSACDHLGILVIDPIPGWQFFQDTPEFRQHVLQDVRETVLRDRNHPCVAIFETCLNETYDQSDEFRLACHRAAHETFGDANFFTGGDGYARDYSRPIYDVPWTAWDEDKFARPARFQGQKGLDREYGDYEFGGEDSTSRADRAADEGALMLQAWNFIWSHNRNRGNSWSFGDLTWEAIDTYRGLNPDHPVSKSGLLDLWRLPKPVAYFYMSQGLDAPLVHIANRWSARPSPTKVVVFSNCDEIELRLNGVTVARQKPDHGPTTGYLGPKIADPLYWTHGKHEILPATQTQDPVGGSPGALPFSGGNAQNLAHPPFTFEGVPYQTGRLEAIGYRQGRRVSQDRVWTPGAPTHLTIKLDTQGCPLEADGADFVFAYVEARDEHNQIVPDASIPIKLSVQGCGEVLGASLRTSQAGIAAFMIRSSLSVGKVILSARSPGLHGVATSTICVAPNPANF